MDCFSALDLLTTPLYLIAQTAADQTVAVSEGVPNIRPLWQTWVYNFVFVLSIFVLPFVLSHFITRAIRTPALSGRLGIMFAAIAAGFLFAYNNNFQMKLGPDMKGGTNLVYEIKAPADGSQTINAGALAVALTDRLNPSGTKEISIRPYGESQIEIIVPEVDEFAISEIKRRIGTAGMLKFRIVANTTDHDDIIQLARQQAQNADRMARISVAVNRADGHTVGRWFTVGREDTMQNGLYPLRTPVIGDIIRNSLTGELIVNPPLEMDEDFALERWLQRQGIPDVDVLMAFEKAGVPYVEVSGDDLASSAMEFDSKTGEPTVGFKLTTEGGSKMLRMTVANQPDGRFHRRMAIILDDKVLSAPQLNSPISTSGQITGRFTQKDVEFLVSILRAGRLPATLSQEPTSETRVGAGLGATTVSKGFYASLVAVIATFTCMLLYYKFAGVVASLALIINGLLIFGIMIFIGQPLTLAGLAGLVLTVGMSVDANVLIFERIREERARGTAARLAIRNGFDRALTTIIDSNLTTLIAAIVLYWIGTDQVRGFAVALIVGIGTSMFTATFCSRIMFEMAEKLGIVNLSMRDAIAFFRNLTHTADIDFMSKRNACFSFSALLLLLGALAVFARGKDLLNIDFTGGTSVTFQLTEAVEADRLRDVTRKILDKDEDGEAIQSTLVRVEQDPIDTVYTLVTSLKNRDLLQQLLVDGFRAEKSADLVTYSMKVIDSPKATSSMRLPRGNQSNLVRLVAFQEPAAAETQEPAATKTQATPAATEPPATPEATVATDPPPATPTPPVTESPAIPKAELETDPAAAEAAATQTPAAGTPPAADVVGSIEAKPPVTTPVVTHTVTLQLFSSNNDPDATIAAKTAKMDGPTLKEKLIEAANLVNLVMTDVQFRVEPEPMPSDWKPDDVSGFSTWKVTLPFGPEQTKQITDELETQLAKQPLWLSLSSIGERIAGEMQEKAIGAVLISLIFIVAYIWFRFQKVAYGLAAVVALVHDVIITLGVMAMCHWLAKPLGFLLIEDFKIGLTEVAAFLTIIGYSLNDTIVVIDRIREVRGKSPILTGKMVNDSVNQTLSRTLLTSGTTILTLFILYVLGGEGIHAFAFALLFGIVIGTYSSIFIAAPILLWLANRDVPTNQRGVLAKN